MKNTNPTPCQTCQTQAKRDAGEPVTAFEMTQWSLWGCTCDPEDEADAVSWMDMVTR